GDGEAPVIHPRRARQLLLSVVRADGRRQLTLRVLAPAVDGRRGGGAGERLSHRQRHDPGQRLAFGGEDGGGELAGRGRVAVAELAQAVVAPASDALAGGHDAGAASTRRPPVA